MKFTTLITIVVAACYPTLGAVAAPVTADQPDNTTLKVSSPSANSTLQPGRNHVIAWSQLQDNSPIAISLVFGDRPQDTKAEIVDGLKGSLGAYFWTVPDNLKDSSSATWKIAIRYHDTQISYSGAFFISNTSHGSPSVNDNPTPSAANQLAGTTATASIDIVSPDGKTMNDQNLALSNHHVPLRLVFGTLLLSMMALL
ncbi:uncharacterized protein BYT42DRAFT_601250 [Radiomyces spectabilis]|uniref:uncharacterized protein n=1 Tax=Radiomyces spectabilis TaxID=64574 RepID=UPI00221EE874|nr:uncharacterized protein BYT42DRAFT_601250 [Radiomyces spectabilis]KAI8393630.1 hypothetical protein BYT42DRAFT_601250 [Radiomyces spectabilis]